MCRCLACLGIIAGLAAAPARAQEAVAQFYKGRQITVLVGSSAGGGYDIYARLLSRHMPKHIPGNPPMVVTNMAGPRSKTAAADLFDQGPRDRAGDAALRNNAVLPAIVEARHRRHKTVPGDPDKIRRFG